MDFSTKYTVRTDLADEVLENIGQKRGDKDDGIGFETEYIRSVKVDKVIVKNKEASMLTGKPEGKYVTVTTGEIWKSDRETFENIAKTLSEIVRGMLPKDGLCLVAALGNDKITADAIGPLSADNLIVSRTFSKSRNLAGARIGFAISNAELIADMCKMKFSFNPYNLNRLSIIAGKESMLDTEYFDKCIAQIIANREYTVNELTKRGFTIPDSKANFIFAKHNTISGEEYFNELRKRNIVVRYFSKERIKDYVRITIGSKEQMTALINATDEILKG